MSVEYTNVRLLSGVPFDNAYAHTRLFDSEEEQSAYFTSFTPVKQGVNYSYQREEGVFRVDAPKDSLLGVNYIMFKNTEYKNKWFYGFVTNKQYKTDDVTFVSFEIDVMQTWMFDYSLRPSYVVREHADRFSSGRPVVNTIDEQLMYGSEYDLAFGANFHPMSGINFLVIITSERMPKGDIETDRSGAIVGSPSSFNYYIVPISSTGETYDIVLGDQQGSNENLANFDDYISFISGKEPFLNRVVAAYVTSYCGINFNVNHTDNYVSYTNTNNIQLSRIDFVDSIDSTLWRFSFYSVEKITSFDTKEIIVSTDIYSDFESKTDVFESKCYMYPYCLLEIADMKGNILTLRPEYLKNGELKLKVLGSLGTSNKVAYVPVGYNTSVEGSEKILSDFSLIDSDPTDIGTKSDYAAAMLQGEKNSLKAQQQNILNTYNHGRGNVAMSAAGAAFSALASGNPAVGLMNISGAGQQMNNLVAEKENSLNALSAKLEDINNVPDTIKQMGSNTSFSYGNFHNNIYIRWKMAKPEYLKRLDNYFKTYGTKTLDIKTPNLKTRRYWNFIKTKEVNLIGTVAIKDIMLIKQIFDAGITLWHDNNVLNYNRQNKEV